MSLLLMSSMARAIHLITLSLSFLIYKKVIILPSAEHGCDKISHIECLAEHPIVDVVSPDLLVATHFCAFV